MIYIGHFYFDGLDAEGEEYCGHFTCMAEADSVEMAVEKFREHVHELRESSELLDGSVSVYIDDIVEIQKVPQKAIAIDFISSYADELFSHGCSIPSENLDGCAVYDWMPDGQSEEEGGEAEPFLEFEYKQGKRPDPREKRHLRVVK